MNVSILCLCRTQVLSKFIKPICVNQIFYRKFYVIIFFAAINVFFSNETMVIGPTPPGTGVI